MCKEQPIREEEYKGYTIKVYQDEDGPNPRLDYDNFGTMVCFHPRYDLGDNDHGMSKEDLIEHVKRKDVLSIPCFLLDHSGLWMRTGRFAEDPGGWDTSFVGYIFVNFETIRKEWPVKRITKKIKEKAYEMLRNEVREYSSYLEGDTFGYVIEDPFGDEVDACWGFIGWDVSGKYMLEECRSIINHDIERHEKEMAVMHDMEINETVMYVGC